MPNERIPSSARRIEGEAPKDQTPPLTEKQKLLAEARKNYAEFASQYEKLIGGYFGTADMTFTAKPGGWYIDLEKIEVNADPKFFIDKGYTESEALFATFHEAEHFRDMVKDPDAYRELFERNKTKTDVHASYPKALNTLYNCIDDILVNRVVMNRWKNGRDAKDSLYPKLFPSADLTRHPRTGQPQPRHRQFMYALLRSYMLADEEVVVEDEVRRTLDDVDDRGEGNARRVDQITAVRPDGRGLLDPRTRFLFIKKYVEPAFEELYKKDLEDRQPEKESGEPGEGKGEGEPFGDDPFAEAIPDPMDFEDAAEQMDKLAEKIADKAAEDFKEKMGVSEAELERYRRDYKLVEPYIEQLSDAFDAVIQRRKSYRRVLRKPVKEGPMLDPRKGATAVAEIRAGNLEPVVMLDYERKEQVKNLPNEFEFTLVCDGSGSMEGAKAVMQRRMAVLATEALAAFRERIAKERRKGEDIDLDVKTEVRMFSDQDQVVKPLNATLEHVDRVKMHKALANIPQGGNNEPDTFQKIHDEQFTPARLKKLRSGDLKKVILFLTDGESDESAIQGWIHQLMKAAAHKNETPNLVIGAIGFDGGQAAVTTYAPNGYYAQNFENVPKIFEDFLKKLLDEI